MALYNLTGGKFVAITKYDSYYSKLCEQAEAIKTENEYETQSLAFAHWYLSKYQKLDNQQIAEALIDGADDLGIDAIIIDEDAEALSIFQFKFPSSKETILKEIDQAEVLKTWNGFEALVFNTIEYTGKNQKFADFKEQIADTLITKFRIVFVSYNKGVLANRSTIEKKVERFRGDTGSNVDIVYHDMYAIANIYERLNRKNNIKISLKYKQMPPSYNVESRSINSYVGFVNAIDLVDAISPNIATIFDENIRLYEYGSKVNDGINRTATSSAEADMFYFYNNGIVFICDKATNSPASNEIVLEGASVVNGCQTLNVLYNAQQKGKLKDKVYLLVRIIHISDYSERMRITEYLNSQTQIKASYFIANHPIIRDLQEKLLGKGYFLERQINEYQFKKEKGIEVGDLDVIQLESTIQYFVGYWDNRNASAAKREKTTLFDKVKIEGLLSTINEEKVIEALITYRRIAEVLTLYRKMRRNNTKTEFADFIGVTQEWLIANNDSFRFMNTGDIILLNCVSNLRKKYDSLGIEEVLADELIVESIFLIRDIVTSSQETNMSALTKSSMLFDNAQSYIESLSGRYQITRE